MTRSGGPSTRNGWPCATCSTELSDDEWRTAVAVRRLDRPGRRRPSDVAADRPGRRGVQLFRWPRLLSLSMNRMIQRVARRRPPCPPQIDRAEPRPWSARAGTTSASPTWRPSSTSWCTARTSPSRSAARWPWTGPPPRSARARVWSRGWPFYPRRRLSGLRLVATDVDWAVGEGPEMRGPIEALLLLITGRGVAAQSRRPAPASPPCPLALDAQGPHDHDVSVAKSGRS